MITMPVVPALLSADGRRDPNSPPAMLADEELVDILNPTKPWVWPHATEIHGFKQISMYDRFLPGAVIPSLTGLERRLDAGPRNRVETREGEFDEGKTEDLETARRGGRCDE